MQTEIENLEKEAARLQRLLDAPPPEATKRFLGETREALAGVHYKLKAYREILANSPEAQIVRKQSELAALRARFERLPKANLEKHDKALIGETLSQIREAEQRIEDLRGLSLAGERRGMAQRR